MTEKKTKEKLSVSIGVMIEAQDKQTEELVKDFLIKIKYRENLLKMLNESFIKCIPVIETESYKKYCKKLGVKK